MRAKKKALPNQAKSEFSLKTILTTGAIMSKMEKYNLIQIRYIRLIASHYKISYLDALTKYATHYRELYKSKHKETY